MSSVMMPGMGEVLYLTECPDWVPDGWGVVHNHVRPASRLGVRGFRAWMQQVPNDRLTVCDCAWAPELEAHYRVNRGDVSSP